jgi:hypothetical protein
LRRTGDRYVSRGRCKRTHDLVDLTPPEPFGTQIA